MADSTTVEARLLVDVQGEDKVKSLNNAFQDLQKQSGETAKSIGLLEPVAAKTFNDAKEKAEGAVKGITEGIGTSITQAFSSFGTKIRDVFSNIGDSVKNAFESFSDLFEGGNILQAIGGIARSIGNVFSTLKDKIGGLLSSIGSTIQLNLSSLGQMVGSAWSALTTGLGIAMRVAVVAAAGLAAAVVAVGAAFVAASAALKNLAIANAKAVIESTARAKRLRQDLSTYEARTVAGGLLMEPDAYKAANDALIKRMSEVRLSKGMLGEKELFSRWGITPKSIAGFEQRTGRRIDALDFMEKFAQARQDLEAKLEAATKPAQRQKIQRLLDRLGDDVVKIFGQSLAEIVQTRSPEEIRRAMERGRDIAKMGPVETPQAQLDQAKRLQEEMSATEQMMSQLRQRLGSAVTPFFTEMQEAWNKALREYGEPTVDFTAAAFVFVGRYVSAITSAVTSAFTSAAAFVLKPDMTKLQEAIKQVFTWPLDAGRFLANSTTVAEALKTVGDALSSFAAASATTAADALRALGDAVSSFATTIANAFNTFRERFGKWLTTPLIGGGEPAAAPAAAAAAERQAAPGIPEDTASRWGVTAGEGFNETAGRGISEKVTSASLVISTAAQSLQNSGAVFVSAINGIGWGGFGTAFGQAAAAILRGTQLNVNVNGQVTAGGGSSTSAGGASTGGDRPAPNPSVFTTGTTPFR